MTTAKKSMTAEEFYALPDDRWRLELIDGEVVELAPGNFRCGEIGVNFYSELRAYVREWGLGRLVPSTPGSSSTVILTVYAPRMCASFHEIASRPMMTWSTAS